MGRIENPGRYLKAAMCAHASIREQGRVPGQEARLARWDCSTPWRTPKRRLKYWGQVAEHERTGEALERVAELGAEQERIAQLPGERVVTVVQDDGDPVSFNRMLRGLSVRFPSPLEQAENERAIRDKKEADDADIAARVAKQIGRPRGSHMYLPTGITGSMLMPY